MDENEILKEQVIEIVDNQLKANDPPETRLTFERLKNEGYSESQIREMIGSCVIVEIFDVMRSGKPFDKDRYVQNLRQLSKEPFHDEEG